MSDALEGKAVAVVFTWLPDEQVFQTPFIESADTPDPLSVAHAFREAEEERNDFPGSIWGIGANERARKIRSDSLIARVFGDV